MTTVELITRDRAPLLARARYDDGDPGPIVAALAHVPELLEATLPFVGAALSPSSQVDFRTKEIAILRTSALLDCRYCTETHAPIALDAGLDAEEVTALCELAPRGSRFADPREAALLDWIDAVATGRGSVPSDVIDRVREHFDDPQLVELTTTIAATLFLNRFCSSLCLPTSTSSVQRLAEAGLR